MHLKYIEAAARMQQFKEVERVCRDSTVYDPQEVKKFLMVSINCFSIYFNRMN